jgi:hypothetical protein
VAFLASDGAAALTGQALCTDPADLDVHLICDNYATHKTLAVAKWLDSPRRFHMHHTPMYASWRNQVEGAGSRC